MEMREKKGGGVKIDQIWAVHIFGKQRASGLSCRRLLNPNLASRQDAFDQMSEEK